MKKYAILTAMLVACFGISSKEVKASTLRHVKGQIGVASWYGGKFIGRKTASGQLFSSKKFTCAHKTLPLGTTLRVKSLENDKEIIVVVNDRGPYVRGRIIDLSPIAAHALGMGGKHQTGTEKVKITPITLPDEVAEYSERNNKKRK